MNPLLESQRQFAAALREPLSGANRRRAGLAPRERRHSPRFRTTAHALVRDTDSLGSVERLTLYQRQYWFRLIDSLAEDFPNVCACVGAARFRSLLEAYLEAFPPLSWNLRTLGAQFPDFLAHRAPLSPAVRGLSSGLAAFDYAFLEVFDATRLPEPTDDNCRRGRVALQPSVRILALARPAADWLHERRLVPRTGRQRNPLLVVWRTRDQRLTTACESRSLLPLLRALQRGGAVPEIVARANRLPAPPVILDAFTRWRVNGWLGCASAEGDRR